MALNSPASFSAASNVTGIKTDEKFDLVVLATGMMPSASELDLPILSKDDDGFVVDDLESRVVAAGVAGVTDASQYGDALAAVVQRADVSEQTLTRATQLLAGSESTVDKVRELARDKATITEFVELAARLGCPNVRIFMGDIGALAVGDVELYKDTYRPLLMDTVTVPSPAAPW